MSFRRILTAMFIVVLSLSIAVPRLLHATTLIEFTDRDLAIDADIILRGEVTSTWTEWGPENRYIYTYGTVSVDEVYKGYVDGGEYIIKRPGGRIGDAAMVVHETAEFRVGNDLILFLLDDPSYESNVLGWRQGMFTVSDGVVVENGKTVEKFIAEIHRYILNER